MKVLLTSTGFDNIKIKKKFLSFIDKDIKNVKVLFITTAAIDEEAINVLDLCRDEILECGIDNKNIISYDMSKEISKSEIIKYDVIYVCGGSYEYLARKVKEINFFDSLRYFIDNNHIYVGVSAGSMILGRSFLLSNKIDCHIEKCSNNGDIVDDKDINLSDNQAICIDEKKYIFE